MIIILTALLIYTIPTNLVFVSVLFLFNRSKHIAIGTVIGLALYLPLIKGMLNDPQLKSTLFRYETITETLPEVLNAFISFRWLLLPFVAYGLFQALRTQRKWFLEWITILLLPFLIFFIQGGTMYGRMFLIGLPVFCLIISIGLEKVKTRKSVIIGYCFLTLVIGIFHVQTVLRADIIRGGMEYGRVSLPYSYWYELYEPRDLVKAIKGRRELPLVFPLIDRAASPLYWERYK